MPQIDPKSIFSAIRVMGTLGLDRIVLPPAGVECVKAACREFLAEGKALRWDQGGEFQIDGIKIVEEKQ